MLPKTSISPLLRFWFNIAVAAVLLIGSLAAPTGAHASGAIILVDTVSDIIAIDTVCSLPEAVYNANENGLVYGDCNAGFGNDLIAFSDALGTATITLVALLPYLTDTYGLTIDGGGDITISGNNLYRVFYVSSGAPLTLTNLTVTGGIDNHNGGGGVAFNYGTLTIINSIFWGNQATTSYGGGSVNNVGILTVTNSTFTGNSSSNGGAIYNGPGGVATITNSVFANNNSTATGGLGNGYGGGIYNANIMTLTNITVSDNRAAKMGGGVYNKAAATLNLFNVIIANNTIGDCANDGTLTGSNNLIESTGNDACGLTNGLSGNIIGSDPNLGPLTSSPAYFPLKAGSPAINAGNDPICAAAPVSNTSQNGVSRLQGPHCDIGTYEFPDANGAPTVSSIIRVNPNPTNLTSADFTVTFSESVTGVDASDFKLTTSGALGATISGISGIGSSYTVTVSTGTGNGSIRLDAVNDGSIKDVVLNPLATGFTSGEAYTVVKAATFADVPLTYWAWSYIERLYNAGITGGCSASPLNYCPDSTVTRAQMAVFLLKGMHGSSFTPPAVGASTGFTDVPVNYWAATWIKQLASEGITGGCGSGIYCPDATVTRAQMAVFLIKAKHGIVFTPPPATGIFTDVPVGYWADKWIEQLASEGITGGCGTGIYCPGADVTRAQMAVFLVKTFNLP